MVTVSKCLVFIFVNLSLSCMYAADGPQINEGWYFHDQLLFSLPSNKKNIDLTRVHNNMAVRVKEASIIGRTEFSAPEETCYACLRMMFIEDNQPAYTLQLSSDLLSQNWTPNDDHGYELVFSSGFYADAKKNEKQNFIADCGEEKIFREIVILPPSNLAKTVDSRRDYSNNKKFSPQPVQLAKICSLTFPKVSADITSRWIEGRSKEYFDEQSAESFKTMHRVTLQQIKFSNTIRSNLSSKIQELQEGKDQFSSAFVQQTSDALKKIEETFETTSFACNPAANDYTCAEQAMFDFFHNNVLRSNIQKVLKDFHKVEGVIVNVCTTYSPCAHCAPTWVMESANDGIIGSLFPNIPVFCVNSCDSVYQTRKGMRNYSNVRCFMQNTQTGDTDNSSFTTPEIFKINDTVIKNVPLSSKFYPVVILNKKLSEIYDIVNSTVIDKKLDNDNNSDDTFAHLGDNDLLG
jgi:hypothetical protein